MHQRILILDYGSQVTQLIARRVREAGVYSEVHPGDVDDAFVREQLAQGLKGIILSGSHASAYEEGSMRVPHAVFELGVPVLGICYGMQSMAQQLGGVVSFSDHREFGYAEVRAHGHTKLLDGLADFTTDEGHGMLKVWMSHGDKVTALPPGFADGVDAVLPDRRHGRRRPQVLRRAVPPRSHAYRAGQGHAVALRQRDLRLPGRLEHARLRGRSRGPHPRAGRRRRSHPGPVRRRGFLGGRGPDPQGHR